MATKSEMVIAAITALQQKEEVVSYEAVRDLVKKTTGEEIGKPTYYQAKNKAPSGAAKNPTTAAESPPAKPRGRPKGVSKPKATTATSSPIVGYADVNKVISLVELAKKLIAEAGGPDNAVRLVESL